VVIIVIRNGSVRPLDGWADNMTSSPHSPLAYIRAFIGKALIITELEARKLRHDPADLLTRAVQPVLWLLVFGEVLTQVKAIPTGNLSYLAFMTPGVLAQSVLFISIFYGISIVWERDLGIVQKFLASPTPRTAIVAGKALSAGLRSLSQALIVFILAFVLGVGITGDPINILLVILVVLLAAAIFATLSLIIACMVKTRDRFMGIGQMITMPLFFASNAIYPISLMPDWLRFIAYGNPLTYAVDALRGLMVTGGVSEYGILLDVCVLGFTAIALMLIGGRLYARVGR
jgi:ABC-2 type transport system permease protein